MRFLKRFADDPRHTVWILMAAGLAAHMAVGLAATQWPEQGDEAMYKFWANEVSRQGMHRAYHFGFDQLPLYLYVSKLVGMVFFDTGLSGWLGPYSRVLAVLLKVPMVLLHLCTGSLVYRLTERLFGSARSALIACAAWTLNPALILATSGFGYPDALPALLAFLTVCAGAGNWMPVWTALVLLSKPQAWPVLGPAWVFRFQKRGTEGSFRAFAAAGLTACVALLPFLVTGELHGVARMFLDIPRVHTWLTGCAHNFWGLFWPSPPFLSDREPLVFGLNGLTLGLWMFAGAAAATLCRVVRRPTRPNLAHMCAFLVFAFFMVMTEVHENHLFPMFSFLAVCAGACRVLRRVFVVLTATFGINLVLAAWVMQGAGNPVPAFVLISRLNALVNVAVLGYWAYLIFIRGLSLEETYSGASSL